MTNTNTKNPNKQGSNVQGQKGQDFQGNQAGNYQGGQGKDYQQSGTNIQGREQEAGGSSSDFGGKSRNEGMNVGGQGKSQATGGSQQLEMGGAGGRGDLGRGGQRPGQGERPTKTGKGIEEEE